MNKYLTFLFTGIVKAIHWGPRGVLSYLKIMPRRYRIRRSLRKTIRRIQPIPGITVIGQFTQYTSHCKTMRDLVHAIKKAGIPCQTFNVETGESRVTAEELKDVITPIADFALDKYDHIIELLPSIVPSSLTIPRARIAFWEFESGFLYGYPDMPNEPHVIAMSDFNAKYFQEILPARVKVSKVLYPFQWEDPHDLPSRADIRQRYGIAPESMVVMFNFDYGSGFHRKNPTGALKAFAKAFANTPDVQFVLKTKKADSHPLQQAKLIELARQLGIADKVVFVNDSIPQRDLFGLVAACDVYLSLHRGEGFGITLAEAMSMGKPVVCTNWSATTEFCKPECTLSIPFKITPVAPEQKAEQTIYEEVATWAEPDIDAAAAALKRLYDDPPYRMELGEKGRASIMSQFSTKEFRKSILAFLDS